MTATTSVTGAEPVVTSGTLYINNQSNNNTQDTLSGGSYARLH